MGKQGSCKVCSFFQKYPYKMNDRIFFETKARQGASLRKLELLLESYGLKAKKDLINKHLKECLGFQIEREIEREAKKSRRGKTVGQKLKNFFIRPPELPSLTNCEHRATRKRFNIATEKVEEYCLSCGELIVSYSVERAETQSRYKNQRIYESLMRRSRR